MQHQNRFRARKTSLGQLSSYYVVDRLKFVRSALYISVTHAANMNNLENFLLDPGAATNSFTITAIFAPTILNSSSGSGLAGTTSSQAKIGKSDYLPNRLNAVFFSNLNYSSSAKSLASTVTPNYASGLYPETCVRSYLGDTISGAISRGNENLFANSGTFSSFGRTNVSAPVLAVDAPVGKASAYFFTPTATNGCAISCGPAISWVGTNILRVYAKSVGIQYIYIGFRYSGTGGYIWFDTVNGVVGTNSSGRFGTISAPDANGYREIIMYGAGYHSQTAIDIGFSNANNSGVTTVDNTKGVILSSPQFELNTVLGDYVETGSQALIDNHIFNLSPKSTQLQIVGSLTRTPVATGSQLVAYSGFSA